MTTERIDHAAEARRIVHEVSADEHGTVVLDLLDTLEQWVYDASMREAQVHATLALVEQQRIANLISLSAWQELGPNDGKIRIPSFTPDGTLRDDIREGLGL